MATGQTLKRSAPLQLWGGAECTINRTGSAWRDQSVETGHRDRPQDYDRIADLGMAAVRFPILWEAVAPERPDRLDFGWTDDRLERLRQKGAGVIGGLVHHGSGPHYTSLIDPDFPKKLAEYAARVAERYPWIEWWTPVNEPLTTARFSALYGHWYPHARDWRSFAEALINQCAGTLQAMRAIRTAVPNAKLLQTEDLGKIFSTRELTEQAAHENERRWYSLDLLCGRVRDGHALERATAGSPAMRAALDDLASGEAAPDMIGINHYLTSERFLDQRVHLYPDLPVGGNGRQTYVDAEAVRVKRLELDTGIAPRLRETWDRYGQPMAITEVHHGCTRDEQLRWFVEVWRAAEGLRAEGVDLRAVTLWSLFGNVDWRSLLTRRDGVYDVGAFDVRGSSPRPTLIASAAKELAAGRGFDHPVLDVPGWWRRPQRLYAWHGECTPPECPGRPLLITGATGTLGQALARICDHRGLLYTLTSRAELDLCDEDSIRSAMAAIQPWAVINAAGFVRVADAERESDACLAANATGAETLARAGAEQGVPVVTFSSDLVFDGRDGPYAEDAPVSPANVYGLSKARMEEAIGRIDGRNLIVRTAAFFGPWDRYNFAWMVLDRLSRGLTVEASATSVMSPTFVPDLCHATLDLLLDGDAGIWHLANQGSPSWHGFAQAIAEQAGYDPAMIVRTEEEQANTALASTRGAILRPLDHAIRDYVRDVADDFSLAMAAE